MRVINLTKLVQKLLFNLHKFSTGMRGTKMPFKLLQESNTLN